MSYDRLSYGLIQVAVSKKCPSFFRFLRKLTDTKFEQITDKVSENNGHTIFSRISTGGVNFIFYHLFYINYTYS